MKLSCALYGQNFQFASLYDVMAKANEIRSGDIQAGLAATSLREMAAAKNVLADITLQQFAENPAVPYDRDEISRLIIDSLQVPSAQRAYNKIKFWSVGELRDWVVSDKTLGDDIQELTPGFTPEMAAACVKLMSNMDLVMAAQKIRNVAVCNNTIGLQGRIASRLQPNHPTDDIAGILAAICDGLSYGNGDAVIGINPSTDSVDNTVRILEATKALMRRLRVPTQNCVLAHIKIQMEAIRRGAPLDLMFQSIAGSELANKNFGINIQLLDEAYDLARREGSAKGPNVMYFETGQGTALSANAHFNIDLVTMEARAYGLARRYKPFIVNSVVGFIGPEYLKNAKEITRAGLEDHFMGKLLGLSMGCDACYTNHADADINDQENLEMLLTLAGVNYLMGIPMGDDVMLNYSTTSFHNNASLRKLFHIKPSPEFETWLQSLGLWRQGGLTSLAGNALFFDWALKPTLREYAS